MLRLGTVLVVLALASTNVWSQVDDRYVLRLTDAVGAPGSEQAVAVILDSVSGTLGAPNNLTGLSLGVCHDVALLAALDLEVGSALATIHNGNPPDFFATELNPQGAAGWTLGVVIALHGNSTLAPGVGHELISARYDLAGPPDSLAELQFCNTLGFPSVQTLVVQPGGVSAIPVQVAGQVSIQAFGFNRGDCDGDGDFQLSDMVFLLANLFPQGGAIATPPCSSACDTNDDDSLDLADAIAGLLALFGQPSTPLPTPYPDCGFDPTPGSLDCAQETLCP